MTPPEGTDSQVHLVSAPDEKAVRTHLVNALLNCCPDLPPEIITGAVTSAWEWIEAHLEGSDPRIRQLMPRTEAEAVHAVTMATSYYPTVRADVLAGAGIVEERNKRAIKALALLSDLDRCQHGRHEADTCVSCPGGQSAGNEYGPPNVILGHDIYGHTIAVPADRVARLDPEKWHGEPKPCADCGMPHTP